jgi:hypothetical protein
MRERDCYGGNPDGYGNGFGRRAMSEGTGGGLVERVDAAALGDWQQAFDLLIEADADGRLTRRSAGAW